MPRRITGRDPLRRTSRVARSISSIRFGPRSETAANPVRGSIATPSASPPSRSSSPAGRADEGGETAGSAAGGLWSAEPQPARSSNARTASGASARLKHSSRSAAAIRVHGFTAATARASSTVSMSRSCSSSRTRSPSSASRARCRSAVSPALIGTPVNTPGCGSRRPIAHQPPSEAGPRTASVPSRQSAATDASRSDGVICGVSMPTSSAGVADESANAPASRSPRPPPRWGMTSKRRPSTRGSQGAPSIAPSIARTRRAAGASAIAQRVSASAAAASGRRRRGRPRGSTASSRTPAGAPSRSRSA